MTVETRFHVDRSDNRIIAQRIQDVEDILDRNKALQNEQQTRGASWHHCASIPNVILERWLNEEYARGNVSLRLFTPEFDALVWRKLRDPDWRWLRTTDKQF